MFTGGGLALMPEAGAGVVPLTTGKSAMRGYTLALAEALKPDNIQVGTVTIAGPIKPGSAFDPDKIAACFVTHTQQDAANWRTETVFTGA